MLVFDDSEGYEQSYQVVDDSLSLEVQSDVLPEANQLPRRRSPEDERLRQEKLRYLGCWLFGSTLRI